MFNIEFYETPTGKSDMLDFLNVLFKKARVEKDARIQYSQVVRHIQLLQYNGTNLPVTITKHLLDNIWELRPGKNRIFYFFEDDENTYVLLHHFVKKTRKTPKTELDRAIKERDDYLSRKECDDNELG
ncbi:MAG: type II toxin-antitoxin system RelE/ParE family toxin [Eubacterium sp.]|nr:type II toxin-antitoxin system RelE/ParE family toxin [Eubacterium sp.]